MGKCENLLSAIANLMTNFDESQHHAAEKFTSQLAGSGKMGLLAIGVEQDAR